MNILILIYAFTIISMTGEIFWILVKGNKTGMTFSFVVCQLLLNIWSVSQILLLQSVNEHQLFISYCIGNTGICWIGTAWLIFSFFVAGKKHNKPLLTAIIIFSAVMWITSLTNNSHHFFYSEFTMSEVKHEYAFYINMCYTYICMILGTAVLIDHINENKNHRNQTLLLILSAIIPLVSNILNLSGVISTFYDITPLAFSISSILVFLATDKYDFLNVNDIAFEKAFDTISEGVAVFNRSGSIIYCNSVMSNLYNITYQKTLDDFYCKFNCKNLLNMELDNELSNEEKMSFNGKDLNLKQYRHIEKSGTTIAVTVIISDVTEYYEMLHQSQLLSEARANLAVERERNRIAQEVHDTTGHTLTVLNALAKLESVSIEKGNYTEAEKYASEAEELARQGIAQLRASINNLRGEVENKLITHCLEQLTSSVRGINVELCIQGNDSIKYSYCSNVIYENVRETITNSIRYSESTHMDVIVKLLEKSVEVYVIDNGKGCENINFGNGLKGMRERTEKIGGNIKFSSVINSGFSTVMKFPIQEGNSND